MDSGPAIGTRMVRLSAEGSLFREAKAPNLQIFIRCAVPAVREFRFRLTNGEICALLLLGSVIFLGATGRFSVKKAIYGNLCGVGLLVVSRSRRRSVVVNPKVNNKGQPDRRAVCPAVLKSASGCELSEHGETETFPAIEIVSPIDDVLSHLQDETSRFPAREVRGQDFSPRRTELLVEDLSFCHLSTPTVAEISHIPRAPDQRSSSSTATGQSSSRKTREGNEQDLIAKNNQPLVEPSVSQDSAVLRNDGNSVESQSKNGDHSSSSLPVRPAVSPVGAKLSGPIPLSVPSDLQLPVPTRRNRPFSEASPAVEIVQKELRNGGRSAFVEKASVVAPLEDEPVASDVRMAVPSMPDMVIVDSDSDLRVAILLPKGVKVPQDKFLQKLTHSSRRNSKSPISFLPILVAEAPDPIEDWMLACRYARIDCIFIFFVPLQPELMISATESACAAGIPHFLIPPEEVNSGLLYLNLVTELTLLKKKKELGQERKLEAVACANKKCPILWKDAKSSDFFACTQPQTCPHPRRQKLVARFFSGDKLKTAAPSAEPAEAYLDFPVLLKK